MSGYRINRVPQEELSFPSLIPQDKTYTPSSDVTMQGGTSVVIGIVVLNGIVREFENV